jgi:FHS family Na+ dependent glucose MFS transporter 1
LKIKTTNWRIASTIAYSAVFLALGIAASWIGPALLNLADHVRAGLAAISILFTARYFGVMSGIIFGGRVYDRVNGHPILTTALVLLAVFTALVPFSNSLWQLAVIFCALGFAGGTIDVGGNTLLAWLHRENVGPYMNALHVFFGVGAILTPIAFVGLYNHSGRLILPLWVFALVILLPGIGLSLLKSPEPEVPKNDSSSVNGLRYLTFLIAAFLFMYVGAEVNINGWLFTYSRQMQLASEVSAAYLTSTFWVFITLGRVVAIPLYSFVQSNTILVFDFIGSIASVGLILLFPRSSTALWLGVAGTGLFMGSVFPTTLGLVEERIGTTGRRTSWFLVGASLGAMVFPWAVGQLFDTIGPIGLIFVVLGSLSAAFGLILYIIHLLSKPPVIRD